MTSPPEDTNPAAPEDANAAGSQPPADASPATDGSPNTQDSAAPDAPADGAGTSFVAEEPDMPVNPDAATMANIEAARYALSTRFSRRPYNAPKSMLLLALVLLGTIALGAGFLQFYRDSIRTNEQGELRRLEEREFISTRQAAYEQATGLKPPAETVLPLSADDRERLAELRAAYGSIWQPDDDAKYLDATLRRAQAGKPTTRSAETDKQVLRELEQQVYMARLHDDYKRLTGENAPMPQAVPLTSLEESRLKSLRDLYGSQWSPQTDADAQHLESLVREAKKNAAATRPAETPM